MNAAHYLIKDTAKLNKDFILGNKETLSYSELNMRSAQIASYLVENYGSGNNVLIASNNNSFFVACYLGSMLSGNVCIPVDPNIEHKNLNFIINQCEPVICFAENKLISKYNIQANHVTEKEYIDVIKLLPQYVGSKTFDENLPAEILYTSGSTGNPKGVVISHKNIIANTNSILKYLQLGEQDILEVVLPFYYCYGLSLLHTHLRVGASIVLNNNFILIGTVINDIKKYKCTGFSGVPSHFQILLRKSESFRNSTFPSLRYVTQAGGKLHNSFIEEFTKSFPSINFYVMYGQTEATARLSYLEPKALKNKLGSIGKAIPDVELKIVNKEGKKVQPGETGEIVAKGDNIMLGYYKDIENTRNTIKGDWLYTGDIGKIDEDGYIYLTARKKEIIKISGKRVSPKEIEEVLLSFPEVVDCTIESEYDEVTGEGIKATVVLREGTGKKITADVLKMYCAENLAPYKVPKHIDFIKDLNTNSRGKKEKVKKFGL